MSHVFGSGEAGMWKILLVRPLVESNNWTRKWRAATRSYGVTLITIFRKTLNASGDYY